MENAVPVVAVADVPHVPAGTTPQTYYICGHTFIESDGRLKAQPPLAIRTAVGKFCNGRIHDVYVDEEGYLAYEVTIPTGPGSSDSRTHYLGIASIGRIFPATMSNTQILKACKPKRSQATN